MRNESPARSLPPAELPTNRTWPTDKVVSRTALLSGASGYVGGRLLSPLLARGWDVRCLARCPEALASRTRREAAIVKGDCLDPASLAAALRGIDTAFYLVHSLGAASDFEQRERTCALNFGETARAAGVRRIVYLGGLGSGRAGVSPHMRSRRETGDVLRASGVPVVELRASIILGSGSLSFELIRALVERLPIMLCPRWVHTLAQPIAIEDVIAYLLKAAELPGDESRVFEIGGADRVSYAAIMQEYARQRGLRRALVPLPLLTPWLSSLWLGLTTPVYARVGRRLIESVRNASAVTDDAASRTFAIRPMGMHDAIAHAIRGDDPERATTQRRRASPLALASVLLAIATSAHGAETHEWSFDVFLNDKPIGHQVFRVGREEAEQRVSVEADFDVRILFFSVYTYRHRNNEVWRDGCLLRIESTTDENGKASHVLGEQRTAGFAVETATTSMMLDDCVWTFAYWDESFLSRGKLLNSQTGAYEPVRATLIGTETIVVHGGPIEARRYALEGPNFRIELLYSLNREWLALESRTGDGSRLRFARQFQSRP